MQRAGFVMRVKDGQEAEYLCWHQGIWPEVVCALKDADCRNCFTYT